MIEFKKFTDFSRGTMYGILQDAYAYDERNKKIWDSSWKESDDFFYDNPEIAEKYGLVTCIDGNQTAIPYENNGPLLCLVNKAIVNRYFYFYGSYPDACTGVR